jgi:hypothetical protein
MGRKRIPQKRIFSDDGWLYYCSDCNGYKPENEFNEDKNRPFGKYYICKEHRREKYNLKNNIDPNDGLDHIKLVFVSETDEQAKDRFLEGIGYDLSKDIHKQFIQRIQKKYGKDLSPM